MPSFFDRMFLPRCIPNPHDGINLRGKNGNSRMTPQFVDIAFAAISEPTKRPEDRGIRRAISSQDDNSPCGHAALFLSHAFGTLRARLGPEVGLCDDGDERTFTRDAIQEMQTG